MAITELNTDRHRHLKVKPTRSLADFSKRHLLLIRADEVARAACNMPILLTSVGESGQWSLSGITSFEPESNLFLTQDTWSATFFPWQFQTWPFNLIPTGDSDKPYTLGIEELSSALSTTEGDALFDQNGQPSILTTKMRTLLDNQLNADIQTISFTHKMISLGLNKPIDIQVHYQTSEVNSIRGLHTIDEDKLNALDSETFNGLKEQGYLAVIYAILFSLYQFNALIQLHNKTNKNTIAKINMEVSKAN